MEKIEKEWMEADDSTSLVESLYGYARYWKWFLLSILGCITLGATYILTSQKQYKSSISVILNEEKGATRSGADLSFDVLGSLSTTSNIDNEIAIFSSPDLISQVIDSLNLQSTYYIKNNLRKTEIYDDAPYSTTYRKNTEELSGNIHFYIQKSGSEYLVEGIYLKNNIEVSINEKTDKFPISIALPDSSGRIHIDLTKKGIVDLEKYYVIINNKSSTIQKISSSLSISPTSKGSSVLDLNLLVYNRERGSSILKELVRQYNAANVSVNNEMAYNTALFINDRLKEIAIELGDVEKGVVDYKQKHRIADLSSEAQLFIQQSGHNQENLMDIETQLNVNELVDKFVNDPTNQLKLIPNLGVSDPALSQLITEYNGKLLDSDALLKSTGEENPMRMRLTEEINNMRNSISGSLKNVKQAYSISKRDIQKLSGSTFSRIQSIPQQEKGLIEKVRQQQIKESLFLFLMQKREETNLSIASTSDKARVIASPQPNTLPIAPKSRVILLASLILGFIIPIIIIYILNLFKTQIENRTDLEKLSKVSVIGQIVKSDSKELIVIKRNQNTPIAEMFRTVRNNLNMIFKHQNNQVIVVTSTISNEGKTFVSVNLAMSFAISDKKVLLIGADIRKPRLKDYVGLAGKKGLTDYLIDGSNNWQPYVNESTLDPNLHVMVSGTIPPNPNELLMSPKLKNLLSQSKREYDVVILDTAPVGLVSDTYLIDELIDTTLYIVREGITPKTAVHFINTQKSENKLHNMYLVLNGSSLENNHQYGYGKGYGYGTK